MWRGWWPDLVMVVTFGVLTLVLAAGSPLLRLDVAVADWCDSHRPHAGYLVAFVLNYVGQGGPLTILTIAVAAWRVRRHRSARPLLVPVAAFVLTYLSIGPLKVLTARPAPHYTEVEHPERLFSVAGRMSYPSGHVANALVWYTALIIVLGGLLRPAWRRVLQIAPVLVVLATTTYLGFHWVTDGVAGLLLGLVLSRTMRRIHWDRIPLGSWLARRGWDRQTGMGRPDGPGGRPTGDPAVRSA